MSVQTGLLADLLREADHFAAESGRERILAADIARAVAARPCAG